MLFKFWLVLTILITGCGDTKGEGTEPEQPEWDPLPIPNQAPVPPASNLQCPAGTELTYDNFGEAFMLNYCTTCHSTLLAETARAGAPTHINFDTPENVQVWRASILTFAVYEGATMPPSQNIPPEDKILLTEWLSCGAPSGSDNIE